MDPREELLTIAQIAGGLAGVSGIVAAFLQRGGLSQADRARFVALFATAFVALLLAFLPIACGYAGCGESAIWRISSGVMAFFSIAALMWYRRGVREVRMDGMDISAPLASVFLLFPMIGNLLLQCLNVIGWPWGENFLIYLVGMLTWLYLTGLIFVTLVLYRPDDPVLP